MISALLFKNWNEGKTSAPFQLNFMNFLPSSNRFVFEGKLRVILIDSDLEASLRSIPKLKKM